METTIEGSGFTDIGAGLELRFFGRPVMYGPFFLGGEGALRKMATHTYNTKASGKSPSSQTLC